MPVTYTDAVNRIADRWIAGLERATAAVPKLRAAADSLPKPPLARLAGERFAAPARLESLRLFRFVPSPRDVVAANYAAAERVLGAQRDFALALAAGLPRAKVVANLKVTEVPGAAASPESAGVDGEVAEPVATEVAAAEPVPAAGAAAAGAEQPVVAASAGTVVPVVSAETVVPAAAPARTEPVDTETPASRRPAVSKAAAGTAPEKKAPEKKTPAKKAPARKVTARKAPAKKAPVKKAAAKPAETTPATAETKAAAAEE